MRPFYLIRHGETDWNRRLRRLQGHTDIPLNEIGTAQAQSLVTLLEPLRLTRLVSSDLSRALTTAQLFARDQIPIEITRDLREVSLGDAEGKTPEEADQLFGADFRKQWSSNQERFKDLKFPNGESRREVLVRLEGCIHRYLDLYPDDVLGFFAHGYVIRSLVFENPLIQTDFFIPNCAVAPFVREPTGLLSYQGPQDPLLLMQPQGAGTF